MDIGFVTIFSMYPLIMSFYWRSINCESWSSLSAGIQLLRKKNGFHFQSYLAPSNLKYAEVISFPSRFPFPFLSPTSPYLKAEDLTSRRTFRPKKQGGGGAGGLKSHTSCVFLRERWDSKSLPALIHTSGSLTKQHGPSGLATTTEHTAELTRDASEMWALSTDWSHQLSQAAFRQPEDHCPWPVTRSWGRTGRLHTAQTF